MPGQHDAQRSPGIDHGDDIAVNIRGHLIGERRGKLPHHPLHRLFLPGRARRLNDVFEEIETGRIHLREF
jgi:hypothetical protein